MRATILSLLVLTAVPVPAGADAIKKNALVGLGIIGTHQYDQGTAKGFLSANLTGFRFTKLNDAWSFGGIGLGFRPSSGPYIDFDEVGVAIPVVSHHEGPWVSQVGVLIQRINYKKHMYWVAAGLSWPRPKEVPPSAARRSAPPPPPPARTPAADTSGRSPAPPQAPAGAAARDAKAPEDR